ncbi:MAG: GDSL-type esterase/lipase family protein [candidate division KSB1 bacterium]|nr:GDSL-type esterase/lipase family protein [candidate division KSB1 bacterium]MDZ7275521.1 GDSL-type esterase/lipase family protein [candidate division KSB1 bacterium]MDZ7286167.1 GDSL-type esterase/lipase family protein [candidate division KSB1 bacterium]MDZ7296393.1 GDSL-type esterase/lipase family protein [candidate division KSB1 bacterium]MDZ7306228.1 GDSL-type esterase/lipase family protein [candidate division KSB1 bacterium]
MPPLSAEQKKRVRALAPSHSDAQIARKLGLEPAAVKAFREQEAAARRQWRERAFKILLPVMPVVFLVLCEVALRLADYGGTLALFVPAETAPGFLKINENVGRRYFPALAVAPEVSRDLVRANKPAGGYRIFVLGESTTAGYPYLYNGSMSKMLHQRLRDYFPDREIEVVNLAMPAINSFALRDLAPEMLAQQPDALIIYCGHNEFYGALGVASTESLGRWRSLINLYLGLQHFKIMRFLRAQIAAVQKWFAPAHPADDHPHATLMEKMAGDEAIPYQSEKYRRARAFFTANLKDLINAAQRRGVTVLLANLVSNERDLPPFVDIYHPATPRATFRAALERSRQLATQGKLHAALALCDSLQRVDAAPASLHFQRASVLEALGRFAEAAAAYQTSRDHDGLRFRASTDFNQALADIAHATGAVLVDVHAAFVQASPHGLIGNNLLLEHVHPNLRGYFLMAAELCRVMQQQGLIAAVWDHTRARPDSVYWQERGVTALDEEVAAIRMAVLLNNWPFVPRERSRPLQYQPKNYLQSLAHALWRRELTWEKGHVLLAEDYEKNGRLDLAVKEYEALILQTPYNSSPYLRAGLLYARLQDFDRAYDRMMRALALSPSREAYQVIGAIWLSRRQPAHSLPYLQKALQLAPNDGQTLYNLASAHLLLGQIEPARAYLAQLEKVMPDNPAVAELRRHLR